MAGRRQGQQECRAGPPFGARFEGGEILLIPTPLPRPPPMSAKVFRPVSDSEWATLRLILERPITRRGRGRPGLSARACLNGWLWRLATNKPWKALPSEYGSRQTVWRRVRVWKREGKLEAVSQVLRSLP